MCDDVLILQVDLIDSLENKKALVTGIVVAQMEHMSFQILLSILFK